jgi:hypothetical protein
LTCGTNGVCQCGTTACGCIYCPPTQCPVYDLNFDNAVKGEYVRNKWATSHGVIITAKKDTDCDTTVGYTPWGAARVFDTASPGTNNDNGDPDLGSPNQGCVPAGPGIGNGGNPTIAGTNPNGYNCSPQGKSLIIQEYNNQYPDDVWCGGTITFDFYSAPAWIDEVGLLDVDTNESVTLTVSDFCCCCFSLSSVLWTDAFGCFCFDFKGHIQWWLDKSHSCARIWRQLHGETASKSWGCNQAECVL